LQTIIDQRPEVRTIRSNNADSNASMLRLNHALGFRPYKAWTTWQVDLDQVLTYLEEGAPQPAHSGRRDAEGEAF
jgi:hypothetical protein